MPKVEINEGYELLQIIKDFGEPLEIFREAFQNAVDENAKNVFCKVYQDDDGYSEETLYIDIWNDGNPLEKDRIPNFFGLAKSTKVDVKKMRPLDGKLGYKGHGSKIFFNAQKVIICSKTKTEEWFVELNEPLTQIKKNGELNYSEVFKCNEETIRLPENIEEGFLVRIINHKSFPNGETFYKLDHRYLRDYILWYTIFGSIVVHFKNDSASEELQKKNICLHLAGLGVDDFKKAVKTDKSIMMDPEPDFEDVNGSNYEIIRLGHILPDERKDKKSMKSYCKQIDEKKDYYDFYSARFYTSKEIPGITSFKFLMSLEGYETKRTYDILLSKKGKQSQELKKLVHSDSERYGFWVCKGGVPVEKVDSWIEGGKGVYSYVQAFIDCDDFDLTANRGSIRNTKIEVIKAIRTAVNDIWSSDDVQKLLTDRLREEEVENKRRSIEEDKKELDCRNKAFDRRKRIVLPDKTIFYEPTMTSKYVKSESETMVLLIQIMTKYPTLFPFELRDYNTRNGIDFVVTNKYGEARYIELKGILTQTMNHPFRWIDKIICYEFELENGKICKDLLEGEEVRFEIKKNCKYISKDENDLFYNKPYTAYQLIPENPNSGVGQIEVICLKNLLIEILGAEIK